MNSTFRRSAAPACAFLLFLALAVAVATRHGAPIGPDSVWHRWFVRHRTAGLTGVARGLSDSTTVTAYVIAAAGAATADRLMWRRSAWALAAVTGLAAGQFVRLLLVDRIGRERPPMHDWVASAGGYSFPSGHSTTSALGAGICCLGLLSGIAERTGYVRRWRRFAAAVVLAWAVTVALTRLYLGVHWPTDVLGGWLLAVTLVLAAAAVLDRRPAEQAPASLQGDEPGDADGVEQ